MNNSLPAYAKGVLGEAAVCDRLADGGMELLERRFRSPFGEIDLVMLDGDTLVFVEVKLRTHGGTAGLRVPQTEPKANREGGTEAGQAAVTPQKRRRLVQAARCYLGAHPEHAGRCVRFDVVTVTGEGVSHVPDAFSGGEW